MRTAEQIVSDLNKAAEEEKRASERVNALKKELTELHKFITNQLEIHIGPVS